MLEIVPFTLVRTKCSFWLFRSGYKSGSFHESDDIKYCRLILLCHRY